MSSKTYVLHRPEGPLTYRVIPRRNGGEQQKQSIHHNNRSRSSPIKAEKRVFLPDCHDYTDRYDAASTEVMPRKRAKLTHLTSDEKQLRRKLKNREAAQVARDRKKDYVETLEDRIHLLEKDNVKLKLVNRNIESQFRAIERENNRLRNQLSELLANSSFERIGNTQESVVCELVELPEVKTESAELKSVSPQQGHLLQAFTTMLTFLLMSVTLPGASNSSMPLLAEAMESTKKVHRKQFQPTKVVALDSSTQQSEIQKENNAPHPWKPP